MTTLTDLKAYLKDDSARWSDAELTKVLSMETAAQGRKCTQPADLTTEPDLYEALFRRVRVNLARRALPLGLTEASADTGQRVYLPGADPEVKRLEAPFRRRDLA